MSTMFFQISPVRRQKKTISVKNEQEPEPETTEILSLAPFAPAPKLVFDRIKVGDTTSRKLLMKNPTNQDITIFLSKKLPEELNVSYSWESKTIERRSEVLFELFWRPIQEESSYHKITFDSNKRTIHRDVPIAFKTISPKKSKTDVKSKQTISTRKSPQKSPTKKYYSTRPPNISTKKYSPSPKKINTLKKNTPPKITVRSPQNYWQKGKENVPKKSSLYTNSVSPEIYMDIMDSVERRGTYTFKHNNPEEFNDSLELNIPETLSKISTPHIFQKRSPLSSLNSFDSTPDISLGSYFRQKSCKPDTPLNYGFEYKLLHLESLCFTPTNTHKEFNSRRISPEIQTKNTIFEVPLSPNLSGNTYVKDHLSSDTFVKDNVSFETYVKGNLSTETYVEDNSVAQLESLSPRLYATSPSYDNFNFVMPERQVLCSIQEESFNTHPMNKEKCDLDLTANHAKAGGGLTGPTNWSKKGGAAFRITKNTSGLKLSQNIKDKAILQISKKDSNCVIVQNPFLLAATNTVDPFITPQLYVSNEWVDEQEKNFKKWLNSLLTPPKELLSEDKVVDVAKVWQECKKREVEVAPTKEDISNKYHVNSKLNNLRKSAVTLFQSKDINNALSKLLQAIDNGKISIRKDRDVHLNISIKSELMKIILSYNPLWLRIGLETIYNETISLHSNSDIVGLSTFVLNRLFKDPYLIKKFKSVHSPKYASDFNKFFLKKIFVLIYFLDQAKTKKLIPHNPCLFRRTSTIKESRELLLILAREILFAVGDITKTLKLLGYSVNHVQTYIHEFDYAVNNLGVDLRDGVRLTKVMEIILLRDDLTNNLRVPAISRLQKVHNMKLVFDSLEKAGYQILYNISHKDIVEGHHEKTLSFLWQIIYKFEAPLMVKNAVTIQLWFRSLPVVMKRKQIQRVRLEKEKAANKIQNWYKRLILSRKIIRFAKMLDCYLYLKKREKAAIRIQAFYRMYNQKSIYKKQIETIMHIQTFSRGWLVRNSYFKRIKSAVIIQSYVRMFLTKKAYLRTRAATIIIQQKFKAKKLMEQQSNFYKSLKQATITIQRQYRAKLDRTNFLTTRNAVIKIQTWYKANKEMKICRKDYLALKHAVGILENRYKAQKLMKNEVTKYNLIKNVTLKIQRQFRALLAMRQCRDEYCSLKTAASTIQARFRANRSMKEQRNYYLNQKIAAVVIQTRFRANQKMQESKNYFESIKKATLVIQRRWRAKTLAQKQQKQFVEMRKSVIIIQQRWRAYQSMSKAKNNYVLLKRAAIIIQTRWRALKLGQNCKASYLSLRKSTKTIQQRWRANKLAKIQQTKYSELRKAAIVMQQRWRAKQSMIKAKTNYLKLKESVVFIQTKWKSRKLGKECKEQYLALKKSTTTIQQRWRAKKLAKIQQTKYRELHKASIVMQQRWRAQKSMIKAKIYYLKLKEAVIIIQTKWKARKLGKECKEQYLALKKSTTIIQQRWRAKKLAKIHQTKYRELRKTAIALQQRWRAKQSMIKAKSNYIQLRKAAIVIQMRWIAMKLEKECRERYLNLRKSTIIIQQSWKAKKLAKRQHAKYIEMRRAALVIQRRWRAKHCMVKARNNYIELKKAVLVTQTKWKAKILAKTCKERYLALRKSAVTIQQRWRANKLAQKQQTQYKEMYKATVIIQQRWRANKSMIKAKIDYINLKQSVIIIQTKWRARKLGREYKEHYLALIKSTLTIQRRWRANNLAQKQQIQYLELRKTVILVQQKWRAKKLADNAKNAYLALRKITVYIQQRYRATKLRKTNQEYYKFLKQATIIIQRRYRAMLKMRMQQTYYLKIKHSAITIQMWYKGCLRTREERKKFLIIKTSIAETQRFARGYLIRKKYAEYFTNEARDQRRIEKLKRDAATKIQSYWKGYKSRCEESSNMKQIRQRYIKASAAAIPENTLEFKSNEALQIFIDNGVSLFQIIKALEDIDYATRRCKKICIRLAKVLPDQLYIMLSAMTRSLPEMNASIFCIHILINFNKLKETKQYSFVGSSINNLVTIMLHWCDKESQLFPSLCTLFWLFAHTPQWKRLINNLPNIKQKFEKITVLVTRKENMVKRQNVKKGASIFGCFKNLPMPSQVPDWGLDYPNNPNVFTNSVHAFNSLLNILNV